MAIAQSTYSYEHSVPGACAQPTSHKHGRPATHGPQPKTHKHDETQDLPAPGSARLAGAPASPCAHCGASTARHALARSPPRGPVSAHRHGAPPRSVCERSEPQGLPRALLAGRMSMRAHVDGKRLLVMHTLTHGLRCSLVNRRPVPSRPARGSDKVGNPLRASLSQHLRVPLKFHAAECAAAACVLVHVPQPDGAARPLPTRNPTPYSEPKPATAAVPMWGSQCLSRQLGTSTGIIPSD